MASRRGWRRRARTERFLASRPPNGGRRSPGPDCPHPGKRHYVNRDAALDSIRVGPVRNTYYPTRAYRCPCGGWAVTSQPRST